jgi:hypothetical protein
MRFMLMIKATPWTEAGARADDEEQTAAMASYHQDLSRAGVLLDANRLRPSSKGFRVEHSGGRRRVLEGPFAETSELVAGYTLIQVKTREEAREWAKRMPPPHGAGRKAVIEVRELYEIENR